MFSSHSSFDRPPEDLHVTPTKQEPSFDESIQEEIIVHHTQTFEALDETSKGDSISELIEDESEPRVAQG
jgi:hypothetical protein